MTKEHEMNNLTATVEQDLITAVKKLSKEGAGRYITMMSLFSTHLIKTRVSQEDFREHIKNFNGEM